MLKLKNVSKYYYQDGVIASGITKVNLELHLGEFVVITGESGSGKSTLLNVLSGLDSYEDGELYINGEETSHYTEEDYLKYRKQYVSNIFQSFNLVNSYTVYQNIELAMIMNGEKRKNIRKKVNDLINKVDLKKFKNTRVSKLSGGQKQRVAIARSLAYETPIIVCDEPTGSLDSKSSASILKLLHDISKDKLVIIVTHNKSEIEKYATRLIKMHDGKILENKVVEKINKDDELNPREIHNISSLSKLKLGIRNTFNLPIKFILMVAIFSLIIITLISSYGGIKISEYEESNYSYNYYFENTSDKRIIINKNDLSAFNAFDYEKIANIENIDFVVENDLINDYYLYMYNDYNYLDGRIYLDELKNVSKGRLPQKNNEIVLIGNPNNYYLQDLEEDIFNETFVLENFNGFNNIKIVGILYDETFNEYNFGFYLHDDLYKMIVPFINVYYNTKTYILNNNYLDEYLNLQVSEYVPKGEAYIHDNYNYYCKNYNCKNGLLTINVKNIYYNDSLELKVTNIYNKNNTNKLLNENYDNLYDTIFINKEDFDTLFNKNNYQSSVFVNDIKDLDIVIKKLNNMGYKTLKLRDAKTNDFETIEQIYKIFKLIVTIILIITLFFITYFIIKIIYKSRNSYYATLRSLGSNKASCIAILRNELFTFVSFTYVIFLIIIKLININIINYPYLQEMTKYLGVYEYILVYLILIVIAILISYRYGRKIFKTSIIKNYGERI